MDGFPEKKEQHKDKVTQMNDNARDDSEGGKPASRKRTIMRTTAIFAVIALVVGGAILAATLLTRNEQFTERLVEVNLEPGETLLYQVEQVLEVRSGELQRGTLNTIVALQVINKTSEEYWFVFKIISINAEGENLEKIGNVTQGRSLYFLVRVERTSRSEKKKTSTFTKADESFELYGNPESDVELTRYARAILTQLLPTVERNLYERVDGEKPDPNSEPKPEKSSMFPGIVKMHREANTSENDELFIKNKFSRSDVTDMTSDVDLDMSYADSSVLNKSNGVVTKGEVHLTERLDLGEPVQFKKGSKVSMMKVSFTSKVTLLGDEKSRRSYLEDKELADVNVRNFVKLFTPKSDQKLWVKTSKMEALNEPSADSNALNITSASVDERETNLTTATHDSRHRSRRQSPQILDSPRKIEFTLIDQKVLGTNMKVETAIHIDSIKKFFNVKLDEIEWDLTLQLRSRSRKDLLRYSIDTTNTATTTISSGIKVGFSLSILELVTLDLEYSLEAKASLAVNRGTPSPSWLGVTVTPSVTVTSSWHGSVGVLIIKAGVDGDGDLIHGSLPVSVSYDASRPSYGDTCVDFSANLRLLDMEARVFYQWRKCWWDWGIRCRWGRRRTLFSFGRSSAFSLTRKIRKECY